MAVQVELFHQRIGPEAGVGGRDAVELGVVGELLDHPGLRGAALALGHVADAPADAHGSRRRSHPTTVASPDVGDVSVVSMRRVVVLPVPLGPRNPTISPAATSRSTPATAVTSVFSRPARVWKVWVEFPWR